MFFSVSVMGVDEGSLIGPPGHLTHSKKKVFIWIVRSKFLFFFVDSQLEFAFIDDLPTTAKWFSLLISAKMAVSEVSLGISLRWIDSWPGFLFFL